MCVKNFFAISCFTLDAAVTNGGVGQPFSVGELNHACAPRQKYFHFAMILLPQNDCGICALLGK